VDPLISPDANTELVDTFSPTYVPFDSFRASSLEPPQSNILELSPDSVHADLVLHAFPFPGPKARPIRFAVNGRKERRAVCVLYEDGEQYDVLDLDGRTPDEEEEDDLSIEGTNRNDDERTVDPTSV
jgi:anaphase-promoting complex subunit 4